MLRYSAAMVDRQRILETLYHRQSLRREARLPMLDIPGEYRRLVEVERWKQIVEKHWVGVEEEILRERRATKPDWGVSASGRMCLRLLVEKTLRERYTK